MARILPKRKKAIVATLLNNFEGTTLAGIGRLTDKQILELYFHKRDKHGAIAFPEPEFQLKPAPATVEECLLDLAPLKGLLGPVAYKDAEQKIREKYANYDRLRTGQG